MSEQILFLDLETRSRVELTDRGLSVYAEDLSTDIVCISYGFTKDKVEVCTPDKFPEEMRHWIRTGKPVGAWNIQFDMTVWNAVGSRYAFPEIHLSQARDIMAWAASNNLPQSLEDCGTALGTEFQKDKRGAQLIKLLCKPDKKTDEFLLDPVILWEFEQYCKRDTQTMIELAERLKPLTPEQQAVWELTQRINARGVPIDVDGLHNAVQIVEMEKIRLLNEFRAITNCKPTERAKFKAWAATKGVQMDNTQAETLERLKANDFIDPEVKRSLDYVTKANLTSTAKFAKMLEIHRYGRVHNLLTYHGASTGRWASRGGLNVQNLARPSLKDEQVDVAVQVIFENGQYTEARELFGDSVMEACSSIVRQSIKAPDGYEFVDADFSSIENRVGVWVAGQTDKVELFREGLDEYKTFSSSSMHFVPYDEVTKQQRQEAKSAVLGCMFGQGAKGLVDYAEGLGVKLSMEQSKHAVDAYRTGYAKVQRCWYSYGDAAMAAVKSPGTMQRSGKVIFKVARGALWCLLPSGRLISWYAPQVIPCMTPWGELKPTITYYGFDNYTKKWGRVKLIGSSIFQSVVQGTAGDLLAHAATGLEDAGWSPIMLVHDEIVCLEKKGTRAVDAMLEIMCKPPAWAADLPLAGEGWIDTRYHK
jgi:DNA polymerase